MAVYLPVVFNLLINLFPPNLDILRRFNPQLYLATFVAEYDYLDIVVDDDCLVLTSAEY
jgi:hypothetical protein